ncbi:MAG: alanine--tRNA ligase [Bacteroidales bacterium]|nr:alanine--tRNA ligase [Bacteroidales bacterium]
MTSNEIRDNFISFFEKKGHTIVPSAPMVVKDDPTLMFTNAGMNQFKEWFLGNTTPKHPRVADTQKCLRVSGKHNDLEEVGHDTYHHTMFEMLGNWSFGDYFKKEAIAWAWELLTEIYKLDPGRLYATVFEGSEDDGISPDNEARSEWLKFLPANRILLGNKKDNFWEMGDTGPCGPCSEIHIDIRSESERAEIDGGTLVNQGHHLVIEIWNLVFIQYNRKANGELIPLPQKHVDTGMGLERLCMAMQGKKSNYDTDVFSGMISEISRITGKDYNENPRTGVAMRVIADHIRAISFSIADGQLPSNVKAGYVIRRILRRAVRYAWTFLGSSEPILCKLVPKLVSDMGEAFPELKSQQSLIEKVIREEEESFLRTLEKGIKMMDTLMERNTSDKRISGADAFVLYDTYGFPIDLSELIAKENGYSIDHAEFEKELEKQKERSRNATTTQESDWIEIYPLTDAEFVGYEKREEQIKIARYRKIATKSKEYYQLVFDKSPFYAESGGQVGDTGVIISESGEKTMITDTIKENNQSLHIADKLPSDLSGTFTAKVDSRRREVIANNHTATHLLHMALREVLGSHIEQKGSLVNYEYFRFDFSHYEKISDEDLRKAENLVNSYIRMNSPKKELRDTPVEQARSMGAIALFGEKYSEKVRVIRFGESIELCGGTHTESTGNIGLFKILSESAIAAGIRRVEATTGEHAEKVVEAREETLKQVRSLLNNTPNVVNAVQKVITENEQLRKKVEEGIKERALALKEKILDQKQSINGVTLLLLKGEYSGELIKSVASLLRGQMTNTAFIAGYTDDNKPSLALMYTDDLVKHGLNAAKDIREAATLIKGGGGGQSFYATAGGKIKEGIDSAVDKLIESVTKQL